MNLLLLDVGNTRLKWGVYRQGGDACLAHGAMTLEEIESLAGELAGLERPGLVVGCVVAGAVVRTRVNTQLGSLGLKCSWVTSRAQQCGVKNGYRFASLLGADRWAAILGGARRMRGRAVNEAPSPYMVVNVGTAVTIDCVTAEHHFLGGLILPGFGLMLKALEMGTAGLRVPPGVLSEFPDNTSDALMTGGALAIAGAAANMYQRLRDRTGAKPVAYLSGGASTKLIESLQFPAIYVEHLVFEGLLEISQDIANASVQTLV